MAAKDAHLYGAPRTKKSVSKDISSSSSLAFSSQLASLIATNKHSIKDSASAAIRIKPKKEDIFSTHNRNSKKRALKDLDDVDFTKQKHATNGEGVDEVTWQRAKRKMEEKARLYSAMKRGDVEDLDDRYAVDFDRKWAESRDKGNEDDDTSDGEDDPVSEGEELIDFVDEFGRNRRGTRAEAAREERKKLTQVARAQEDRFTARPSMPANVIHGDTIQSAAFNPDVIVMDKMADIAAKRDHHTPPPDQHFDSKQELRQKGVGFFQFSGNAEERKKQMENLEVERKETEARRNEAAQRKEQRRKEVEERRKKIQDKKVEKQTDRFLTELTGELEQGKAP